MLFRSNVLEDALVIQMFRKSYTNTFENQRTNEVEKIDQRDFLMILNNPSLILYIEFVIPDKFKNVKIKAFLFTKMIKELVKVSMV